ncbi:MAG: DUF4020 domain-containing protein [Rhodopirellula sp.]|nr:DUF4020 domain-containing protein [Rhodopirellula sp.]
MFFNSVRLPDEVRIALEEERLVVFVGAGVSCPPPSNLPLFDGLASQIAGGKKVKPGTEDRFLGKLARENQTDVHAAAARIVFGEHTKPTVLHREILRLFGSAEKVRVVTTNFDDHFSVAARKLFRKKRLPEFSAPALPLGDDFTGLVYLHGSARIDPQKLVLTDKDFGTAYLTRGWARDFLVALFSKYTVLFVGYSHGDVTTTYLARGLNQSEVGQRRAMVSSDTDPEAREKWDHLEIPVVEYPIDPSHTENEHQALTDFFSQWADHAKESIFARSKRVNSLARALPPESDAESEYLRHCLAEFQLANEFCGAIRHPAWIGWMHDRGYFDSFFDDTAANAKVVHPHNVLAYWLCSYVRLRFPELLLDMIRSHRQRLNRGFSRTLARLLLVDQRKKPDPRFATWVSVLLSQGKDAADQSTWGHLLQVSRIPGHLGVAFRLFEMLTTPELCLEKGWGWRSLAEDAGDSNEQAKTTVDYSIKWPHESSRVLRKAWAETFEPHLPEIAEPLARILVGQFMHAYLLFHGVGETLKDYDRLSRGRSSIATHAQDELYFDKCFSCLIDILRSILDHWIVTNPPRARWHVEDWWSSGLPLLMRFAAYARSHDPQYDADERIEWVLANDLVFRSGMKKEVFDILASAYLEASQPVRRRLLGRIDGGYRGPGSKKMEEATRAYEKFNVLVWLRRSDPECPLVASAISEIHEAYPHFNEREHPGFDSWRSKARFVGPTDGFDLEQIVSEPPEQFVANLLNADSRGGSRDLRDHLQCLPKLFKQNREWSRGFVEALARQDVSNAEVWNGVFWAWRNSIETQDDWVWILDVLEMLPHESVIYEGVANLVAHGFEKWHSEWGDEFVDRAASLMERAWELCKGEKAAPSENYGDWLTTAINDVGGWVGEFWVHYCSHLRQRAAENWQGIPVSLRSNIVEALRGTTRIKTQARIALTPWIGYFFAWDHEFAVEHLLPLLDWERDPIVAQQSWSVLLDYKQGTSKELEDRLIPFYLQCAQQITGMLKGATEKSEQFDEETLQHLGQHLAVLAMQVISDPVESGFFRDFLPLLSDDVRGSLAWGMGNQLKELDDAECQKLWDTWLKRYLDLRLVGVPVALVTAETEHMLEWCLYLGPAFEEAVDRVTPMPQKSVFAYGILVDLATSPAVDQSPLAACRLANAALEAEDYPDLHDSLVTLHEKFENTIRRTPEFVRYEELLYQRGWRKKHG